MDAAAEIGSNPAGNHQIQPEYNMENEQADPGRDGRSRLVRSNSRHERGHRNVHFRCSADHEQDWQPYPVDPHSAICDDHTYIRYLEQQVLCCLPVFR